MYTIQMRWESVFKVVADSRGESFAGLLDGRRDVGGGFGGHVGRYVSDETERWDWLVGVGIGMMGVMSDEEHGLFSRMCFRCDRQL